MAKMTEKSVRQDAVDIIKSDVRALRKALKSNNLDEKVWEAVGDNYWFKLFRYPDDSVNFVIKASRGTRKGFKFELYAVDSDETYHIPIDSVEIKKEADNLYLLEFEGEEGGYIHPIVSEYGF